MPNKFGMRSLLTLLIMVLFVHYGYGQTIQSSGPTSFCAGGNTTLNVNGATNGSTFQWRKDGSNIGGPTQNSLPVTVTGAYSVIVTPGTNNTPDTLNPVTITVNPLPAAPAFTFTTNNQCASTPFNFVINSPVAGVTYTWDFGDASSGTGSNVNHTFQAIGNATKSFNVRVTATTAAGCSTISSAQNVIAKERPDPNLFEPSNFRFCGNIGSISPSVSDFSTPSANNNYEIIWGDVSSNYSSLTAPSGLTHTYPTGTFTLTYNVTGSNGCIGTQKYTVLNITNPRIGAGIPSNTQGCGPKTICFPINEFSENHITTTYVMDFGDGSPTQQYTHPPPDSVCHTYTTTSCGFSGNQFVFTVRAINGCDISKGEFSPVRIYTSPVADFEVDPNPGCVKTPVTINNKTKEGFNNSCSNSTKYNWDFGDGTPPITVFNNNSLSHVYATSGTFSITLLAENGCGTNTIIKPICITDPPTPGFGLSPLSGCSPLLVNVNNTTTVLPNTCKAPTYLWNISYTQAFCGTLSDFTYANNTSDTSTNPSFKFDSSGTYTIEQSVTNACGIFKAVKTVDVKTKPKVEIVLPSYSCGVVNIAPTSTVTNCGSNAPSYAWTFADASIAASSNANPGNITFTTNGSHLISLAVTNECGTATALDSVVVTVAPNVTATTDKIVCGGVQAGPFNFTSTIGTPNYNWTNNNPAIGLPANGTGNIDAFTAINDGTTPITATIIVTPVVSNCIGIPDTFTITVNPKPPVPVVGSPVIYCQNAAAAALTATASGSNTLTWYNNSGLTGGTAVAPIPLTNTPATTSYYVTQTNSFNCLSDAAVVIVIVNPSIAGNTIAAKQNICANTIPDPLNTQTSVTGGDGIYIYQWQSSVDGGTVWNTIPGTNSEGYAPPALTATTQYRRVTNSSTCSDTSVAVTITVQGALANYDIAASQEICEGFAPALLTGELPTGGGGGYKYVWEQSTDNINWVAAGGAGQNYQPPALFATTYYRRHLDANQCSVTSPPVTITVDPTPDGDIVQVTSPVCIDNTADVSFTATIGTAPFTVVLEVTNPDATKDTITQTVNSNGPSNIQVLAGNNTPGIYTIRLIKLADSKACERKNILSPVDIAVLTPVVNKIKKDTTICDGQTYTITNDVLSGGAATNIPAVYTFQWESAPANTSNWQPISGATDTTLTVNPSVGTCYRRKTKSNNLCESVSNPVCVNVNPGIVNNIISADQELCINIQPANFSGAVPSGGNGNYIYAWETSTDAVQWLPVVNTLSYQPPVYTVSGIHYFRRNVTSGNCTSASNVITITVKDDSKASFTASSNLVCSGTDLGSVINVSTFPDRNGQYNWYADGVLFGANQSGIFPGYIMINTNDTTIIKLVTQSQFGCKPDSTEQQFITFETAVAKFTKGNAKGCGPLTVPFTNTSNLINNSIQFFWDFGNGITSTDAQPGSIIFNTSDYFNDTTYYVTLKAYNGCDTTIWSDSVEVRANPKARFGLPSTSGCSPFTVNLNNTSLGGPNTYYWDFGNGHLDTTTANGILSYTYNTGNSVDTFPIRLIAVNECGSDTQTIDIRIAPNVIIPQININSSDLYGCIPHIVTFINSTFGATSYKWNFNDGTPVIITNNNEKNVVHTFNTPGDFNVQIDITNGCSDTTVFRQVTVYAKPKAAFTTNASVYCLGDTVKVNNTSSDASNYRWFWGDGQADAGDAPAHVYTTAGNYDILLRAERTNNFGVVCFDTLVVPIRLLVKPDVSIQTNINVSNCAPFTLSVSAPNIINENVDWYFYDTTVTPSVITSNGVSAQYIFNNAGTFKVKMIASNAFGCKDSTERTFTIKATPVASFTPGDLQVCKTDTVISYLNTTTYNDFGPVSYRWLVGNTQFATTGNFTHQYTMQGGVVLPQTFSTTMIATNTIGCSDTAIATLQLNPSPDASFSIINPNNCVPFIPTIVDNSNYVTDYKWLLNGQLLSTDQNPSIVITQPSTAYTLTLVGDNIYGCKPDTFAVNFTSRIKPNASFTVNDTLGCSGFLNVATNNKTTGANLYTWDWGDGSPTVAFNSPTHLYNNLGQYMISLIASDGVCKDTALRSVTVSTKPIVDFAADPLIGCGTVSVQFSNLSQNATEFSWYFGDGNTSNSTNPQNNFAPKNSPYTIKLVAYNTGGCKDSLVKANYILAKIPPAADFNINPSPVITIPNYTFSFTNLTPNSNKYTYQWDLDDGTFADTRDVPDHKYADTGNYYIQLIVLDTNMNCTDTIIKIARIDGIPGYLYVPNAFYPNSIQTQFRSFKPLGKGLEEYHLQIFDNWGKLLFESRELDATGAPLAAWDGTFKGSPVQQDTYVWKINAKFKNGKQWDGMVYSNMPGKKSGITFGTLNLFR